MAFKEFEVVEIKSDMPLKGVKAGMLATIIDVYDDGEYEVEVMNSAGNTVAILSVKADQIRVSSKVYDAA